MKHLSAGIQLFLYVNLIVVADKGQQLKISFAAKTGAFTELFINVYGPF